MAQQFYVKRLCELLTFLGVEQADVVRRLGVSQTNVSFWWTGRRPVARKYIGPFLAFVREQIHEDRGRHRPQIAGILLAWGTEIYVRVGLCKEEIRYELEVLKSTYATVDPLSLDRQERRRLHQAARMLMLHLDYLDYVEQPLADPVGSDHPEPIQEPLDILNHIAAAYHFTPWPDEEASDHAHTEGE